MLSLSFLKLNDSYLGQSNCFGGNPLFSSLHTYQWKPSTWLSFLSFKSMWRLHIPHTRGFARRDLFCSHWIKSTLGPRSKAMNRFKSIFSFSCIASGVCDASAFGLNNYYPENHRVLIGYSRCSSSHKAVFVIVISLISSYGFFADEYSAEKKIL